MNRWWLAGVVGVTLAASVVPDEEVGACSIYCPGGSLTLELAEVRLVEAAPDVSEEPVAPEWPETGELQEWGSMWLDDGTYFSVTELVEEAS